MSSLLIGFISGIFLGVFTVGFGLYEYFQRSVNNRYVRYLEAKVEYHFGQRDAFSFCRDLLLQSDSTEDAQAWVFRVMGEAEEKAQGILNDRLEEAHELAVEDTHSQLEERREL